MKVAILSFQNNTDIIGAKYIHAYVRQQGYESVLILQPSSNCESDGELCRFIREQGINVIGISVMSHEYFRSCEFAKRMKMEDTSILLVFGGIHATVAPEECLEVGDVAIRGEGERAFLALLEHFEQGRDISALPGIAVKKDGEVTLNPPQPLIEDLDTLPFPRHFPENMFIVHKGEIAPMNRRLFKAYSRYSGIFPSIVTTRGCPFSCAFCCNSAYRKLYGRYDVRKRSVESVVSECEQKMEQHPELLAINFQDDCFLANKEDWIREFSQEYKRRVSLPFFLRTTPLHVTLKKMTMLRDAGLVWAFMGLQSGSDRVNMGVFNRNVPVRTFLDAAGIVDQLDLCGFYDVILNNPYETEEDLLQTLDAVLSIPRPFQLQLFTLCFFQGTELHRRASEEGLAFEDPRKCYSVLKPSNLNKLIRMAPTYPGPLVRYLAKCRHRTLAALMIWVCDFVNVRLLEPLSFLRLMHKAFGKRVLTTIKIVVSYRNRAFVLVS